ncbi:aminotransferase class IV [Aliiglaciecola lipolytica]|uniref:aminotransferase class IV n=1 Tax=Aliiglaciecola lipolytica TaxID=477689 RepID=UPI001C0A3507|nr:aminotransferase class IV [Aliiglaciecola lipolytica]MBU2877222.1 aminotransferase class IV [Aliiglaciecola lipolytica]
MTETIVYLNGTFMPQSEAMISPLDRGFLFGDGIYEVIPAYDRKMVGFTPHIARLQTSLSAIGITLDWSVDKWRKVLNELLEHNSGDSLAVYIQVSRGVSPKRQHGFPDNVKPTMFMMCYAIKPPVNYDDSDNKGLALVSQQDLRWRQCHIKSTSLLGNVLHYQSSQDHKVDECLLYNENKQITEASSCNVFVVKDKQIFTPPLDSQLLPGITRAIVLDLLTTQTNYQVFEQNISLQQARSADEIWLTSSTKNIAPAVSLDGEAIADGKIGEIYKELNLLFNKFKYDY